SLHQPERMRVLDRRCQLLADFLDLRIPGVSPEIEKLWNSACSRHANNDEHDRQLNDRNTIISSNNHHAIPSEVQARQSSLPRIPGMTDTDLEPAGRCLPGRQTRTHESPRA